MMRKFEESDSILGKKAPRSQWFSTVKVFSTFLITPSIIHICICVFFIVMRWEPVVMWAAIADQHFLDFVY